MTVRAFAGQHGRHYSTSYASAAVGPDSTRAELDARFALSDDSVTIGHQQSSLFSKIVNARAVAEREDWDSEGGAVITDRTVAAAIQLLHALPTSLLPPDITAEGTGEIAFEWFRDARHVAVLTVQDDIVRWAAVVGTDAHLSGAEPFTRTVPSAALEAIWAVLD